MSNIVALSDPCPLPGGGDNNNINRGTASSSSSGRAVSSLKVRKDSLLYAPMANVGRVTMDREGTYIELKHIHYTKREQLSLPDQYHLSSSGSNGQSFSSSSYQRDSSTPADLLRSMQDVKVSLDEQLQQRRRGDGAQSSGRVLSMFANSSSTTDEKYDETDSYDDEGDDGDGDGDDDFDDEEEDEDDDGNDDDDDDDDDDEDRNDDEDDDDRNDEVKQSSSLLLTSSDDRVYSKATSRSSRRPYEDDDDDDSFGDPKNRRLFIESTDLMLLVYGPDWTSNGPSTATRAGAGKSSHRPSSSSVGGDDDEDELFALPSSNNNSYQSNNNSKKKLLSSSTSSSVVRPDHQYRLDNALDSSRVWTGGGVTVTTEKGDASSSMSTSASSSSSTMMMSDDSYSLQHRTLADQIKQHSDTASSSSLFDIVRRRCVTGGYGDRQIEVSSLSMSGEAVNGDDDDNGEEEGDQQYDAFEDLQTGEKFSGRSNKPNNDDDDDDDEEEDDDDEEEDQERRNEIIDQELREINARKKASFKASFDRRYDEKLLVSPR